MDVLVLVSKSMNFQVVKVLIGFDFRISVLLLFKILAYQLNALSLSRHFLGAQKIQVKVNLHFPPCGVFISQIKP
ncbi:hypothetical protein L2E82_32389 [Cichorium intybus]|uniref:Uncharacterized protein n=1 Tax=Cichorium intybus TaxID=13427 RepID=A0ACB9BFU0_CICIN|nr:hypothetical protein L2E82_32389 [Cichorium intybus]